MPTYIMLTRLSPEALREPSAAEEFSRQVEEQVLRDCPNVKWISNYAILGPYDYLDVFEASGEEEAVKLSLIVRSAGHATTETWIATPWERFVNLARAVSSPEVHAGPPAETEYVHVRLKGTQGG